MCAEETKEKKDGAGCCGPENKMNNGVFNIEITKTEKNVR